MPPIGTFGRWLKAPCLKQNCVNSCPMQRFPTVEEAEKEKELMDEEISRVLADNLQKTENS